MKNQSLAIIGQGFVGGSLTTVMNERGFTVFVYDKMGKVAEGGTALIAASISFEQMQKNAGLDTLPAEQAEVPNTRGFVEECERQHLFSGVYFVCLPTPMYEDGAADLSIVESTLDELAKVPGSRIAVVKSTVPPGSTETWNKKYAGTGLRVVFSPEFLTEANALDDMRNQNRIVLGGPRPHINKVKEIFQSAFPSVKLIKTSSTTAEMVKYVTNCFLATKVAFANEMSQICEALDATGANIDYDKVVEYARLDERLGTSHWAVPGPDGSRGYGGHCFPKDVNALVYQAKQLGISPTVIEASWKKNLEVRAPEHRDWERMFGRAVSKRMGEPVNLEDQEAVKYFEALAFKKVTPTGAVKIELDSPKDDTEKAS